MKNYNTKPTFFSIASLRDPLFHNIMEQITPLIADVETGKVSVGKCLLKEKDRWQLLKKLDKKMINARGNPVAGVRLI